MLRAVVVLALVAVALAQNSPYSGNSMANYPLFSNVASEVRFVPRPGRVLAVNAPSANSLQITSATPYRVVSVGADAVNPHTDIPHPRSFFGNFGRERFQDAKGVGMAPQGHLALSLDPTARGRVIRDRRLIPQSSVSTTADFLAVPEFKRTFRSLPLEANDIVLATSPATWLVIPSGYRFVDVNPSPVRYFIVNEQNVAGIYTAGLRLNGDSYAANIAGELFGGN